MKHVDTASQEYHRFLPMWKKARTAAEGQRAVHEAGEDFIPKLSGMTDKEFTAYIRRTLWYNATSRTLEANTGLLFRKDPRMNIPTGLEDFVEDVDLDGTTIRDLAEEAAEDLLLTGREGILVDYPNTGTADLTVAEVESLGFRPFVQVYKAEQIRMVKVRRINNRNVVTMVKLEEEVDVQGENEFDIQKQKRIRILDLNEAGQYRQRLYIEQEGKDGEWIQEGEDIIVQRDGAPLNYIPFFFMSSKRKTTRAQKPPMIDLVNANVKHYQVSADYYHGGHFTALPTVVITGHQPGASEEGEPREYKIGSMEAWILSEPEADAKFLEFQGQGLKALENQMERLENQMAVLGARMIAPEKRDVEAKETHMIKRQGENSVLASIGKNISETIEIVLREVMLWMGMDPDTEANEVEYQLNRDFFPDSISPQMLTALVQAQQSGSIAWSDFVDNLKRGEIIDGDRDPDEILAEIQTERPGGLPGLNGSGAPGGGDE